MATKKTSINKDIKTRAEAKKHKETTKKYNQLQDDFVKLQEQLDAMTGLRKSNVHHEILPEQKNGKSRAVAVALLSDWHIEEWVDPKKVNGLNEYTVEIARQRADYLFQKIARLMKKEQQDAQIDLLVLAILGDMISGAIHDELLENCSLRPAEAILVAQEMLQSGIQYLLDNTDVNIYLPCSSGNHGRSTHKVRVSTEYGNSFETLLYHSLKQRFSKNPRIEFEIGEGYHIYRTFFDNYTVRFSHGHAVNYYGGVGGVTISLNKAVAQWNLTKRADCDCMGHFHVGFSMPRYVMNGSLIGYSAYSLRIKAEIQPPTQMFFLISEKHGKSLTVPIVVYPS